MKIYSVYDAEFKPYGKVVEGLDGAVGEILAELRGTPLPEGVVYVASEGALQQLGATDVIRDHCFGGMPVQMGWCNGHNTRLNCLEYHRDSEFNLGTEDFILLLARQDELEDMMLDTAKVKAFRVPKGVLIECYATTLHYAPCQGWKDKGFKVMIALPYGTNTDKPDIAPLTVEDGYMTARNKWLFAHPESSEAKEGAKVGLKGENIDIAAYLE